MDKNQKFIDWVCGNTDKFPFMKNLPQVHYPIGYVPPLESPKNKNSNNNQKYGKIIQIKNRSRFWKALDY